PASTSSRPSSSKASPTRPPRKSPRWCGEICSWAWARETSGLRANDVLESPRRAVPVEARGDEILALRGDPAPERAILHDALETGREGGHVTARRHERRLPVHSVVAAAAVVERDGRGPA